MQFGMNWLCQVIKDGLQSERILSKHNIIIPKVEVVHISNSTKNLIVEWNYYLWSLLLGHKRKGKEVSVYIWSFLGNWLERIIIVRREILGLTYVKFCVFFSLSIFLSCGSITEALWPQKCLCWLKHLFDSDVETGAAPLSLGTWLHQIKRLMEYLDLASRVFQ